MSPAEYDPRYLAGSNISTRVVLEAEVWEELWADYSGPHAVFPRLDPSGRALHHFGNGNIRGAKKLYNSSRAYWSPIDRSHWLDLERFFTQFEHALSRERSQRISAD